MKSDNCLPAQGTYLIYKKPVLYTISMVGMSTWKQAYLFWQLQKLTANAAILILTFIGTIKSALFSSCHVSVHKLFQLLDCEASRHIFEFEEIFVLVLIMSESGGNIPIHCIVLFLEFKKFLAEPVDFFNHFFLFLT